ncbi:MAG TPA: hypothetical protein VG893_02525 [Terracidiphilus sp.]|nr:hypothetical protein [Terracidiphilus sp.]
MSYVSFSPDGTMIAADAATSRDDLKGGLTLWRFPEGTFLRRLPRYPSAISPNWKYYATREGIWSLETGKLILSMSHERAVIVFSPDSRYIAEYPYDKRKRGGQIRIIEIPTGRLVSAFGRHLPGSLAFSPDGSTLAVGYWDAIALRDVISGKQTGLISRFEAPQKAFTGMVNSLGFSRNGKLLVAGVDGDGMWVFEMTNHKTVRHFPSLWGTLSDPAFSPDGKLLAVGEYGEGTVWLIDTATWKFVDHKRVSDMGCGSVDFSPDGHYLITPSTGGLITWPYDRGGTVRVFEVVR